MTANGSPVKRSPWSYAVLIAVAACFALFGGRAQPACCATAQGPDSLRIESLSPKGALIRSVIYPGWGQLANGKPYKACVILGVETYLAGVALSCDRRARDAGRLARAAVTQEQAAGFEERRSRYKDRRNAYFWWLGAAILYSMLDAYVDASLAGVSEGGLRPPPVIVAPRDGSGLELGIVARF